MTAKNDSKTPRRLWVVRPGRKGSPKRCQIAEDAFFEEGIAGLDDRYGIGDVRRKGRTTDDIVKSVAEANVDLHITAVRTVVSNVVRLQKNVTIGDIVVSPSRLNRRYCIGVVESEYQFSKKTHFPHSRKVKWIGWIDKDDVSIDAQRELGAARLFFECRRNSEEMLRHVEGLVKFEA